MQEDVHTSAELRTYLRQRRKDKNKSLIPEFEDFLKNVSSIFALRISAEEYWSGSPRGSVFNHFEHKYQAKNSKEALPLDWKQVQEILLPEKTKPPVTIISYIAAHCIEDVRIISSCLRRVLSRERISTPVGKVQQLDTYCMRWLMRQPGRSFTEKAGTQQRVMAVVRREQFDTLENRVFKDFLIRAEILADSYLDEIREEFIDHPVYKAMRDFKRVCQGTLSLPEMAFISAISTLPQPNYVLQQDNRYSVIWLAYCKIVSFANLAEKLWAHKKILAEILSKLVDECKWQIRFGSQAYFYSQVWINKLDGNGEFIEHLCINHTECSEQELSSREKEIKLLISEDPLAIIDLSGNHMWGRCLLYDGFHLNARCRIDSHIYPVYDDFLAKQEQKITTVSLPFIFAKINEEQIQNEHGNNFLTQTHHIYDYCTRLYGELHNQKRELKEIVILVPDNWNAITQEIIIKSFPMIERSQIHLLWRSVATVLGMNDFIALHIQEYESVAVIDFHNDGEILVTRLTYLCDEQTGRLIPQRSALKKNGEINESKYFVSKTPNYEEVMESYPVTNAQIICLCGIIPLPFMNFLDNTYSSFLISDDSILARAYISRTQSDKKTWYILSDQTDNWSQQKGSLLFAREHNNRTLYFDELEAMWIIGQDEIREKIVSEKLVEENSRFNGGTSQIISIKEGKFFIGEGQRGVEFLFHIGDILDTTPLHQYKQDFMDEIVQQKVDLSMKIIVSPGQGMAVTSVNASIFRDPIILDYLNNMTLSNETIAKKNEEFERSFPPTSAVVEAYNETNAYGYISDDEYMIQMYLRGKIRFSLLDGGTFYHARKKREDELKLGESKLHCLDRFNIFGNVGNALRPIWMTETDEEKLISDIYKNYESDPAKVIRLLAWTYRGENPLVQKLTRIILRKWIAGDKPKYRGGTRLWHSLMANILPCKEMSALLPEFKDEFIKRVKSDSLHGDDLRLLYNLIQFDVDFSFHAQMTWQQGVIIASSLCRLLTQYRIGQNTNNYDCALRSLLYLLRLREKERCFLRKNDCYVKDISIDDYMVYTQMCVLLDQLNKELQLHLDDERENTTRLRQATYKFLNGSGLLRDVLSILDD